MKSGFLSGDGFDEQEPTSLSPIFDTVTDLHILVTIKMKETFF